MMPYERKAYTDAVLCLQSKPSKLADGLAPGAKSRYDDFVAIHINNTMTIHATVSISMISHVEHQMTASNSQSRPTSSRGTDFSSGTTSKLSATSAATLVPSQ
jgi:hypothetical protein